MGLLRAASSISALTLLSRVLGLVRDVMLYHVVGANWATGSFVLAWMVPNLLRRLFGEGALSAAFVPAFTRTRRERGDAAARGLLGGVTGALLVVLGGVVAVVLAASWLVPPELLGLDGGPEVGAAERGALILELLRVLFPYALPVCLLATYAGALHALGVFAPTAAAPALLNVFWIAGLGIAAAEAGGDPAAAIRIVAWSVAVGGAIQLLLGLVPLARRGMLPRPHVPRTGDGTRGVFLAMAPAALGLSIAQLNLLVDQALAEYLIGPGANNHVYLANRLLLFPHALVAVPLATAVFPTLAARAGGAPRELGRALRYVLLLSLPAAAGMIQVAPELIEAVFVHGRFTEADAASATATTVTLVASLPALGAAQLYSRALFAIGDTRTPARIAVVLVVANVALNLVLVLGLGFGVEGFTLATTCCAYANVLMLRRAVRSLAGGDELEPAWLVRPLVAVGLMLAALAALDAALPAATSRTARVATGVLVPSVAGAAVFVVAGRALRIAELLDLLALLTRRGRTP